MWVSVFLVTGMAVGVLAILAYQHWRDKRHDYDVERYDRGWRSFNGRQTHTADDET